jgi:hypothetical protein
MQPVEALVGLAEIAFGLAGFVTIVLVLGTRANRLDSEILGYVRIMVSNAIGTSLGCLFSAGILGLEISSPSVWILLSGFMLLGTISLSALNWFLFIRHHPDRFSARAFFWWSFIALGCLVHIVNATGLFAPPSFGLFFLGLSIAFSQAAWQFVYLVYGLLKSSAA